jgi:hypothetical protein
MFSQQGINIPCCVHLSLPCFVLLPLAEALQRAFLDHERRLDSIHPTTTLNMLMT